MKVGVHQGSVLSPLLFSIVVDVLTDSGREALVMEVLCVDDLVLVSETMEGLKENFWQWKKAFESKALTVNLGKTKMLVNGVEGELLLGKVEPSGVCGTRAMANEVLCTKWEE